jgi:hypothetical protein
MENISLELAYARSGAEVTSKQRNLSAIARDGSLILSCPSDRFSRPGVGVLRYTAQVSQEARVSKLIDSLRTHIQAAHAESTDVHPVMITPPKGAMPRVVHVRPDLTGKVVEFDGDTFVVDFTRPEVEPPPKIGKRR